MFMEHIQNRNGKHIVMDALGKELGSYVNERDADVHLKILNKQPQKTKVQSIICSKKRFKNKDAAKKWVKKNKYRTDKIDETEDSFRFRQRDPADFKKGSFRTITLTDGVKAVIGKLKEDE